MRLSYLAILMAMVVAPQIVAAQPVLATKPATPLRIAVSFQNAAGRMMSQPPELTFGGGYLLVTAKWPTTFTEKDDVSYRAWISCKTGDFASANAPAVDGEYRQYAYLTNVREGARSSVPFKLELGYRPAGLSSFPVGKKISPLPESMPLPAGQYVFTATVQRVGPGGAVETSSLPFTVTVGGDASLGAICGVADFQVVQRKDKSAGDVSFSLVGMPAGTAWTAKITKADQMVGSASGTISKSVESVAIDHVPVGGPYTMEIEVGALKKSFKEVYIGDLWIISGQSNAVGVGYEKELYRGPMPGVHTLNPKYGILEWTPARDGLFESTMGPWVTAAQEFYTQTGVPVGLIGHAVGSKPMDFFYDAQSQNAFFLRPLIERYGQGAAVFFWYQGESDSFAQPQWEAYGGKLAGLVTAVRSAAKNPDLPVGIVQIARYTWWKDDHFAPVREAQRQFMTHDPHAVIFSTMPYVVNNSDKIHITSAGQAALGKQIAAERVSFEKTGQLTSPGPVIKDVKFAGADQVTIVAHFDNGHGLAGNASTDEWFVTDSVHRGFRDGGFVEIANITFGDGDVTIHLKSAPNGKAALSYGYRADTGGSLVNADGYPAACFVKVPVQ